MPTKINAFARRHLATILFLFGAALGVAAGTAVSQTQWSARLDRAQADNAQVLKIARGFQAQAQNPPRVTLTCNTVAPGVQHCIVGR